MVIWTLEYSGGLTGIELYDKEHECIHEIGNLEGCSMSTAIAEDEKLIGVEALQYRNTSGQCHYFNFRFLIGKPN